MQKELEQTRMKFSLASQEITSLKAAAQQAQREKEQVMLPSSFIYKSIIKGKRKWKKKKQQQPPRMVCTLSKERKFSN